MGRTLGLQVVTAAGTVALARLLSPSDYGLFALALAVQQMTRSLVEEGLTAALVRRDAAPTVAEQEAIGTFAVGVALLGACAVMFAAFAILPLLGIRSQPLQTAAVACLGLPLSALRLIPSTLLIRGLSYGRLAVIEVIETLSFYAFAVPAAVGGFGAYSLAGAIPTAAAAGAVAAAVVQPSPRRVRWDLDVIRPLARFSATASVILPIQLAREVAFISLMAGLGSQALAGFYALTQRLFSLPTTIYVAVSRASFPALSRVESGVARSRRAGQAVGVSALAISFPLTLIVAGADPGTALIFGTRWLPTVHIVEAAALGLLLAGSVGAVLNSLALADGDARTPLGAAIAHGLVTIILAILLVPSIGATGAGLASGGGCVVFSVIMLARAPSVAQVSFRPVLRIVAVAAGAAAAGALLSPGRGVLSLVAALAAGGGAWLALARIFARSELTLLIRLLRQHIGRSK